MFKKIIHLFLIFFLCSLCWAGETNKPNLGKQINWSHPLTKGLVSSWLMNENGGDKIYDLSNNNNTGTFVNNTNWVRGKFGSCLSFDGADDYVNVADSPSNSLIGALTISAWINVTNYTTYNGIVGKTVTNIPKPYDYYLLATTGLPKFFRGNGSSSTAFIGTAAPGTGKWVNIVVTAIGEGVCMYLNGVSNGSGNLNVSGITPVDSDLALRIGNRGDLVTDFNGLMDNVQMWNRVLSPSEVLQLYREPFCMFEKPSFWSSAVAAARRIFLIQ